MSKTRVAIAALLVLATASLTGCDVLHHEYVDHERPGGITPAAAEALLMDIDGITAADYATNETYSPGEGGMFSSEGMDIVLAVTVDPQYSVADPGEFFEFLAATAWSVNDHYPDGAVMLAISGGLDRNFDWAPAASEVLGTTTDSVFGEYGSPPEGVPADARVVSVSSSNYGAHFGRWPSEPVDTPEGLLQNTPPEIIAVPAIIDVRLRDFATSTTNLCTEVVFERSLGGRGWYEGVVTSTIYAADGTLLATADQLGEQDPVSTCFGSTRPDGVYATVSTAPADSFTDVTETVTAD